MQVREKKEKMHELQGRIDAKLVLVVFLTFKKHQKTAERLGNPYSKTYPLPSLSSDRELTLTSPFTHVNGRRLLNG